MKRFYALWLVALCCGASGLAAGWDRAPDIVRQASGCEFRAWYVQKGTRSEGIHGELVIAGATVPPGKEGAVVSCALGDFTWHGRREDRKSEWSRSGWLPKNLEEIYPSWSKRKQRSS